MVWIWSLTPLLIFAGTESLQSIVVVRPTYLVDENSLVTRFIRNEDEAGRIDELVITLARAAGECNFTGQPRYQLALGECSLMRSQELKLMKPLRFHCLWP